MPCLKTLLFGRITYEKPEVDDRKTKFVILSKGGLVKKWLVL
jgi:hypothetical protein